MSIAFNNFETPTLTVSYICNPFDWLVSIFKSGSSVGDSQNFTQFVNEWCVNNANVSPFLQLFDDLGQCICDVIIRHEHLAIGLNYLDEMYNMKMSVLPSMNTDDYKRYYNHHTIRLVEERFRWELDTFQYNFFDGLTNGAPAVIIDAKKIRINVN